MFFVYVCYVYMRLNIRSPFHPFRTWPYSCIYLWYTCKPNEVYWIIGLLYCNQTRFHLMQKKCFWLLPRLYNGISLELEWQQVSSSLQNSSQYPGRFQQCNSLDDLDSPSDFQFLQDSFRAFGDLSKHTKNNLYLCHPNVPQLSFCSLARSKYLSLFSLSVIFTLWSVGMAKSSLRKVPPLFFVNKY